eukprot:gene6132-7829_t
MGLDPSLLSYGLKTTMNSDEAVARGAALQCAMLSSRVKVKPFNIIDKLPYDVVVRYDIFGGSSVKGKDGEDDEGAGEDGHSHSGPKEVLLFERGSDVPRPAKKMTFLNRNTPFSVSLAYGVDHLISTHHIKLLPPTEETKEVPPGESPAPQKRRYRKIEIPVETVGYGLSKERLKAADDLIRETAAKRNGLESYLFTMRDKLDGPLKAYATDSERMQFQALLDNTSNWLYDEGYDVTKLVYARKLEKLKQVGNKFESRSFEEQNRQQACDALRRQIDLCKTFKDKGKIRREAESTEAWLFEELSKQAERNTYEDPVITIEGINKKRQTSVQPDHGSEESRKAERTGTEGKMDEEPVPPGRSSPPLSLWRKVL